MSNIGSEYHAIFSPCLSTPTINTTHKSKRFLGYATITHPYHPHYGKQLKILFTRIKSDRDVFCLALDGSETITVLRDWTDRADDADSSDKTILSVMHLMALSKLLREIDAFSNKSI